MRLAVEACPVCGARDADAAWPLTDRYYPVPGTFEVRRCGDCHSTFVADPPEDISPWYGSFYYSYNADPPVRTIGLKPWLKRRVRQSHWMSQLVRRLPGRADFDSRLASAATAPSPRALDIGCGNGDALSIYRAAGWQTYGVEFSDSGAQASRSRGHEVVIGDFNTLELPWSDFDLVRASHVIEHVLDPMAALRKAASLVSRCGLLLAEIPNLDGALARVGNGSYWQLDPPRHLAIPHRTKVVTALRHAGFSDISVTTYSSGRGVASTFFMWRKQRAYMSEREDEAVWRLGDAGVPRGYRFAELLGEPLATLSDALGLGDSLRVLARRDGTEPSP